MHVDQIQARVGDRGNHVVVNHSVGKGMQPLVYRRIQIESEAIEQRNLLHLTEQDLRHKPRDRMRVFELQPRGESNRGVPRTYCALRDHPAIRQIPARDPDIEAAASRFREQNTVF